MTRQISVKKVEPTPWCESLTRPIANRVFGNLRSEKWTKGLTLAGLILPSISALLILKGLLFIVPLFMYINFVIDDADGIVSRNTYGKDPVWRGTLDFVKDHAGAIPLFIALCLYLPRSGLLFLLPYVIVSRFYLVLTSTRFRLGFGMRKMEASVLKVSPRFVSKTWIWVKKPFERYGKVPFPTGEDGCFLMWVIGPLFNFHPLFFVLAILAVLPQILMQFASIWVFLKREKKPPEGRHK